VKIGITERGDAAVNFDQWVDKLDQVDGAILITKDPHFILQHWRDFDSSKCIIHCTITGWGGSKLEPNVATPGDALWSYWQLCERAPEQIVLRIDPIIPTKVGLRKAKRVYEARHSRVRTSILDLYTHVRKRLAGTYKEIDDLLKTHPESEGIHLPLPIRQEILRKTFEYDVEICGEPDMPCTGCVSLTDLRILGLPVPLQAQKSRQRKACACLSVKKELLTRKQPCKHGCLYCYWR
jgi:hypothetical protein